MTADTDFQSKLEAAETAMSVSAPDPSLRDRYERVALISHPRHLEQLGPPDPSTLVVATEWLAWWVAKDQGRHATHYESRLAPWPDDIGSHEDIYKKACDWVYLDGKDVTEYKGVSLGHLFGTVATLAWMADIRLEYALEKICRDVQPGEMILFDLSSHFSILSDPIKLHLAASIAESHGICFIDRLNPVAPDDPLCQTVPLYAGGDSEPKLYSGLRNIYTILIAAIFRVRWWLDGRPPKIFFFTSLLTSLNLIHHFRGRRLAPVFLAATLPKNLGFLMNCWRQGVILERLPKSRHRDHGQAVKKIIDSFASYWRRTKAKNAETARRIFIRENLFDSGRIHALAEQVDRYDLFFRHQRFNRVVTGDVSNPVGRTLSELAHTMGIPIDETLNGMFLCNLKDPSRCGDGIKGPTLSRELAMGDVNVEWLDATASPIERVITGYPAIDAVKRQFPNPQSTRKRINALVLPGHAFLVDVTALRADFVPFLINCIRVLEHHGFDAIRIKLHPEVENRRFYEQLVKRFDLPAEVRDDHNFLDHLEWTDIVVGPSTTGTFLETLAAGKPYYVYRPTFSSIPQTYLRSATVVSSATELNSVLASGIEPDIDAILRDFCATNTITNASECVWHVLEDSIGQRHPASRSSESTVFEAGRRATK